MKIFERESIYIIENIFPKNVFCGFTKRDIFDICEFEKKIKLLLSNNKKLRFVYLNQLHSPYVKYVKKKGIYDGDGLFSREKNLVLVVKTADCLPLYFYGEDIIGMIHLSWRSALGGILENIKNDLKGFSVIAGVGLRSCCYEVGREFLNYERFVKYLIKKERSLYFSPIKFAKEELKKRKLNLNNFYDLNICSFCNQNFYSWRRETTYRRTFSFIVQLKS